MPNRRGFLFQTAAGVAAAAHAFPTAAAETSTRSKAYRIPRTELTVSRMAYGCVQMGWGDTVITDPASFYREIKEPLEPSTVTRAVQLINAAYDNGITLFDLADFYGAGKAESAFGEVLRQSKGLRQKIVIQTKCGWYIHDGSKDEVTFGVDLSRDHIISAVHGSLRRLGTDYVDILLLHAPDALVEPDEIAAAFDELQRQGKVRYFGVQDHSEVQIELLKKSVRVPLVVNQLNLSLQNSQLLAQGAEHALRGAQPKTFGKGSSIAPIYAAVSRAGIVEYCQMHDIQIQAYSPLKGELIKPGPNATPEIQQAAQVLTDLAKAKNTTPPVIALAWLLRHPASIVPIFGTRKVEHIIENCGAKDVTLSREEWYKLFSSAAAGFQKRIQL
jgi:predicted oxidoreductase